MVGVGGQSAIRWVCTFVRNICQSRRYGKLETRPHTHSNTPKRNRTALPLARLTGTPAGPGRGGPRARAARPARRGRAGLRGRPGAPQRPRQTPRGQRHSAGRASSRPNTVRPHTRHAAPAVNILRTYTVSHARTSCVRPSYGLTSTSTIGDHRNILAHSNDGAPLPQTPPPIVSSAASSRPRLWVVEGGDGMNARRGRMRAGLLRRGAGQGRGRMFAWRLAGRQMGFCRLPPKSPRCGSVSERY